MVLYGPMDTNPTQVAATELHLATLLVLIQRSGFRSDAAFCSAAQIDPSHFVKIKKGAKRATPDVIRRMAEALQVPLSVLARPASRAS